MDMDDSDFEVDLSDWQEDEGEDEFPVQYYDDEDYLIELDGNHWLEFGFDSV